MNFLIEHLSLIVTLFISIIALIISALAFFRGRNIDLQNQLYLKKLDAFEMTTNEFFKLLSLLRSSQEKLLSLDIENLSKSEKTELNNLSYQIDSEIDEIQKVIAIKSVYFSEYMIEKLLSYLHALNGDLDWERIEKNQDIPELMESYIQKQTEELEAIINEIRQELGLDNLNQKLFKRIKKGNFRIDV